MAHFCTAPDLPLHFVPRPSDLAALKSAVLSGATGPIAITGPGLGGLGKSVLAAALAHDAAVRQKFTDGIAWLTVGPQPTVTRLQSDLARALVNIPQPFDDSRAGEAWLSERLQDKACLLILDDVRQIEHLEALSVVGERGCLVFTTRDTGRLAMLGAFEQRLAPLDDAQALALLAAWAGRLPADLPALAVELARECGHIPMALALMGALLQDKPDLWHTALHLLRNVAGEQLARQFEAEPYPDPLRALQVAVTALPPEARKRYFDLAVFPPHQPIPEAALQTLWAYSQPGSNIEALDAEKTQALMAGLGRRALLQRDANGLVRLHALQWEYVGRHASHLPTLHARLVQAYQAAASAWHLHDCTEPYLWRNLPYHLIQTEQAAELEQLVLDLNWLHAQLAATDVATVLETFTFLPHNQAAQRVRAAIRAATDILLSDTNQLAGQLVGRLLRDKSPALLPLLKQAARWKGVPWLRPLTASLPLPASPLERSLGHRERVLSVVASPDGQWVVSGAADGWLHVWNLDQGREAASFKAHRGAVLAVALLPDKERAVSGGTDDVLKVWRLAQQRELGALQLQPVHLKAMTLTPDGRAVIAALADGTLRVWTLADGGVRSIKCHAAPVWAVAALPDNRRVLTASDDGLLRLWNLETQDAPVILREHRGTLYALAVTPDGRRAVSGSSDGTLKVWDLERNIVQHTLKGHTGPIRAVTATPDGEWAISASDDGTLKIWEIERGTERATLVRHAAENLALAMVWDGRAISASADGVLRVWDLEYGADLHTQSGHRDTVNALTIAADGSMAISASDDRTLKVWNLKRGPVAPLALRGHTRQVNAVALSQDNCRAVSASKDRTLRVWNLETAQVERTLVGHLGPVNGVAIFPDGWRAVSCSADRTLRIWDIERGDVLATLNAQTAVTVVVVLNDGQQLVTVAADSITVWGNAGGNRWNALRTEPVAVTAIAAHPAGPWVALGAADGTLRLWDALQGVTKRVWPEAAAPVTAIAVTPDGRQLACGAADGSLKLWDAGSGKLLAGFSGVAAISACAIAPGGKTLVAGEKSGRMHFLRLEGVEA
jgi:WD40 repeat protein